MAMKLFLKIFFSLPVWLLRCMTFQKNTVINNQILDFQTQIFIGLQSLQADSFDDPNSTIALFHRCAHVRWFLRILFEHSGSESTGTRCCSKGKRR